MSLEVLLFLIGATTAVATALLVVWSRNPVVSALFLVLNLGSVALLFLTLAGEFLAAVQVILYAGAIMVLFLFVIMLLNPDAAGRRFASGRGTLAVALVLAALFVAVTVRAAAALPGAGRRPPAAVPGFGSAAGVGSVLFTTYLYPFEITSVLLLVAMVGAVVLAKRRL